MARRRRSGQLEAVDDAARRTLAKIAEGQAGYVTRLQLLEVGVSRSTIQRMAADGRLVRVGVRTFRVPGAPPTWAGRALAATLDTGGVASHRTAGALQRVVERRSTIEVMVSGSGRGSSLPTAIDGVPLIVHRTTSLPSGDVLAIDGVPCTSAARTLLSLASLVPGSISVEAFDDLIGRTWDLGLTSEPWLWWLLERRRCSGRTGVAAMEAALVRLAGMGRTESWLERAFLRLLDQEGIARPVIQRRVAPAGAFVARVDFWFAEADLLVEVLGYRHHRTRAQLDRDLRRANDVILAGRRILQFSHDHVVRSPAAVIAQLRAAGVMAAGRHDL